jgi:hypothetical protein
MTRRARIRWAVAGGVLGVVFVLALAFEEEYCPVCARARGVVCLWPFGPVGPRIIVREKVRDSSLTRLFTSRGVEPGGQHEHEWVRFEHKTIIGLLGFGCSPREFQWGRARNIGAHFVAEAIDDDPGLALAVMQRLLYPYDTSSEYGKQLSAVTDLALQYAVHKDPDEWRAGMGLPAKQPGGDK